MARGDSIRRLQRGTPNYLVAHLQPDEAEATLPYTGSEPVSAKLWAGDGSAPIGTVAAEWKLAPDQIRVTIPAATTTDLSPGRYRLAVYVADEDVALLELDLESGAVTGAESLPTYCTADDLLAICPWFETYLDHRHHRSGGETQRALARRVWDRQIVSAARDLIECRQLPLRIEDVEARLAADRLVLTSDQIDWNVYHALWEILRNQYGKVGGTSVQQMAANFLACRDALWVRTSVDLRDREGAAADGAGTIRLSFGLLA